MSIRIVGGGIGGTAAALFLHQAGMDVTVYEQASELVELGAGIIVAPNMVRPMRKLGVAALPEDNDQIIAATYCRYLTTEAELAVEPERERAEAERVLRLTAPSAASDDFRHRVDATATPRRLYGRTCELHPTWVDDQGSTAANSPDVLAELLAP